MPKCPACGEDVQTNWVACPICTTRLDSSDGFDSSNMLPRYSLDQARYLWERHENGRFLYDNFKSVKQSGVFPFSEVENIRKNLTDYAHLNMFQIRILSTLHVSPLFHEELMKAGKLLGYYTIDTTLKTTKMKDQLYMINDWKQVFAEENLVKALKLGWIKHKTGDLKSIEINKKENKVRFKLNEVCCSIKAKEAEPCMLKSFICGECEALGRGLYKADLMACEHRGDTFCEVEVYPELEHTQKDNMDPQEISILVQKANEELNNVAKSIVDKKLIYPRENLGDSFHLFTHQCMNFLLGSLSPGHVVISKYSGRITGERIAEKAGLNGLDPALAYLEDMFLYLKAGILHTEKKGDRIIIRMKESVYASGVNNIHMNLCIFLAGIIEGALNKATGQKWDVSEMKCLASGFPECEFWCKKI